jgi:hypothetical protein
LAEEVELEAIRYFLGCGPVVCETDCASVKLIVQKLSNLSSLCYLINDTKERIASDQVMSLSFCKNNVQLYLIVLLLMLE